MSTRKSQKSNRQRGGASSDYASLFHAWTADPAQLSRYTLAHINQAPMFHPLQTGTVIPTGTSGIIPTGAYLASTAPIDLSYSIGPPVAQYGGAKGDVFHVTKGGKNISNPWIAHVFKFAEQNGLTYSQALKHADITKGYKKTATGKSKSKKSTSTSKTKPKPKSKSKPKPKPQPKSRSRTQ